ncbi:MAG: hypothetical protein OXG92_10740, partial [Chloroflexi bacterium]|nr:hypothetical protein [Chloroflexota bacterium]
MSIDIRLQGDDAIEMAIHSGNLLYEQNAEMRNWALTLIVSNLFELVAEVEEPMYSPRLYWYCIQGAKGRIV